MIISEQEKNRIRGLHNIKEQHVPVDSSGNPIEPNPLLKKSKDELVKNILVDSQALTNYIETLEGMSSGTDMNAMGIMTKEKLSKDITTHQTRLNNSIGAFITFLDS